MEGQQHRSFPRMRREPVDAWAFWKLGAGRNRVQLPAVFAHLQRPRAALATAEDQRTAPCNSGVSAVDRAHALTTRAHLQPWCV